jgi:protein O-mannosyl-transferase
MLALCAAGVCAYSTSFAGVFVYDDDLSIVENPHIKTLWPLTQAMSAPPEATVSGRPVASLTLALNYAAASAEARDVMAPDDPAALASGTPAAVAARFYSNVWGYHLFNLAVHLAAALTLFGIVRRTLLRYGDRFPSTALAFVIALIWIVHPLATESVTYIVQRVESLMGLFYLLTLYCAIRAIDDGPAHPSAGTRRNGPSRRDRAGNHRRNDRNWWVIGSVACCALGMGTKEVMVTAPIMVWLWDVTFEVDQRRRLRLYGGLAATWIILGLLVAGEHRPQSVGFDLGWTWWSYLETQAAVVGHYLRLAVVPNPLVFDYGWPAARSLTQVWPQALLLSALVGLTLLALIKRQPFGFLGAWVFLILAPTSSVLPIASEVAAEHRMYLPAAAVIVAVVIAGYIGGRYGFERLISGRRIRRRAEIVSAIVVVAAIVVTFAETTRARNRDYWSDETLWIDTIAKRPSNVRARVGYGIDMLAARRFAEAEKELGTAVALDERDGRAHMNFGSALCAQGRLSEGIRHLERALELDPRLNEAYGLLGEAYSGVGDQRRALTYFMRALDVLPDNRFLLNRVAWLLATSLDGRVRDGAKAVELSERAVRLGGRNPVFLATLAAAYAEVNRFDDAGAVIREAVAVGRATGQTGFESELGQELALYASGQKLRARR